MRVPQCGVTAPADALSRTLLLLRDFVPMEVPDDVLASALTSCTVVIVADRATAATRAAQTAIVTSVLLCARSGASITLEIPDTPLAGPQAPLVGERLATGLQDVLDDLIPGIQHGQRALDGCFDVAVVVGSSAWRGRAHRTLRLFMDAWSGAIEEADGSRSQLRDLGEDSVSPFGALAAAGLAAGEVFKSAVAPLRRVAYDSEAFDLLFASTRSARVSIAPVGTPLPRHDLGEFDAISGGAIIQSTLFALGRIADVTGTARVIEPERGDLTNLNRYAFLRRSRLTHEKATDLAMWGISGMLGGLRVMPVIARYDAVVARTVAPLESHVLVGVDDIPTRWLVQSEHPRWLGVGATTHFASMASFHTARLPCARCLHYVDDPGAGPIPTVAFVSHWAGVWLAALFVRAVGGEQMSPAGQMIYQTSLRSESASSLWRSPVARRVACPLCCAEA